MNLFKQITQNEELLEIENALKSLTFRRIQAELAIIKCEITEKEGQAILETIEQEEQEIRQGPAYERWQQVYNEAKERALSRQGGKERE